MAQDKKISKPGTYQTSDGTTVWLRQEFVSEVDANGILVPGSTTINLRYYPNAFSDDYVTVATRKSGENWKYNNVPELGTDLKKTLSNKNSLLNVNLNNKTFETLTQKIPFPAVQPGSQQNQNTNQTVAAATGLNAPASGNSEIGDFSSSDFGKITEKTGTKTDDFGTWKYPDDIAPNQDVIKFTMLKYEPRSFEASQSEGFSFANRSDTRKSIGNVTLPIPSGIRDQNIVNWNQEKLNPLEIAAAGIAKAGIEKGINAGFGQLATTLGKLQGGENNADTQSAASNLIAGAAAGIGQQLLTRATGAIINPNMELLFSGPSLRPFSFTFKLSARNKYDADQIIGIIRFFKRGMAAQRSESELFLKSPHTFKLQYLLRGKENHPYIGQIKECALKNFSVNYTPENNYATYESGLMVSYEITMDFQELEPIFNDDYEGTTGIGY